MLTSATHIPINTCWNQKNCHPGYPHAEKWLGTTTRTCGLTVEQVFVINASQTNAGYMGAKFRPPPFPWVLKLEFPSSVYEYPQEMNMEKINFGFHPETYSGTRLYFWPTVKKALANISFLFSKNKWWPQTAVSSLSQGEHEEKLDVTIYQGHCRWHFYPG